jgi:hypothetical protein
MTILQRESLRVTGCRRFGSSRIFFFESAQSAESEVEGFGAGVEKLDLELAIGDLSCLPDELVEPLFDNDAVSLIVDVCAVCRRWWMSIEKYSKANRLPLNRRTHDQIEIPGMKLVRDSTVALI